MSPNAAREQFRKRFLYPAASLAGVMAAGTVGYRVISGGKSSLLDSFYMTFITVATIGYGEITDGSAGAGGRLFTVLVALAGIGTMTYILMSITAFVVEGQMNEAFRRRRMEKAIERFRDHYIVCGSGGTAAYIVRELIHTGRPHLVVDDDRERLARLAAEFPDLVYLENDPTDDAVLEKSGIARARGVFAVTGDDNRNLVVSLTARQLNHGVRVVAGCAEVRNTEKIRKAGADAVVSPTYIGGLRMASEMIRPTVVSFLDTMMSRREENLRVEEIPVPASFSGRPLSSLDLGRFRRLLLLALRRADSWEYNPPRDLTMREGDTLIFMSTPEEKVSLEGIFSREA
jgi:voltage-gated potassium channel